METRTITRGDTEYTFQVGQIYAEYDDRGAGNYYKITQIGVPGGNMTLVDPEEAEYGYFADYIADKLMLLHWVKSTEAEFQQCKEGIERRKHRSEINRSSSLGVAKVTIGADISDFEAKIDSAIAKLKEFIALAEKAKISM